MQWITPWLLLAIASQAPPARCELTPINQRWEGSCGVLFGLLPTISIAPAERITSGVWRKDLLPTSVWAGQMTVPSLRSPPIEIELYSGGTGVLRTPEGWFPVSAFFQERDSLRFNVDTSRQVSPSDLDRQIVQRAAKILSSDSVWDRADDRRCSQQDTTWSIYCAMARATVEVTGAFHHRRPALEVVRVLVEERTKDRKYEHRLMGYNNDPTTHLSDVQRLFADALSRMK